MASTHVAPLLSEYARTMYSPATSPLAAPRVKFVAAHVAQSRVPT
jgi:hypothetical protein